MTASNATISLAPVERLAITIGGERTLPSLPRGLAARVARAVHEAIARVVPANVRPTIFLDWQSGSMQLGPDESEFPRSLSDALQRDVLVHRGREGGRIVVRDGAPAFLNGWPLAPGIPHLLGHGDIVRLDDQMVAVRFDPPARPLVEASETARTAPPGDVAPGFRFAIEPSGEPLEVRCDPAAKRSLAGMVLRRDADRAFDSTALADVERATLDWLVHRIVDRVAGDAFGSRVALRPAADGVPPDCWASVVVRIGGVHGTVWVGTSRAGLAAFATALEPLARQQHQSNPAIQGIHATMSARMEIGRVPAASIATLAVGDLLATRDVDWLEREDWSARGCLVLAGANEMEAPVHLDLDEAGRLSATLLGKAYHDGGNAMTTEVPCTITDNDHPFADALDAIGVTVAIEVARRRIRLSEALGLASGDVIELGAPVTANVALMIDGTLFARGELVDVEGTLGVRVVAMGGRR